MGNRKRWRVVADGFIQLAADLRSEVCETVVRDPFKIFSTWYRDAAQKAPATWIDPTAMTLATADRRGVVSARQVLLKAWSRDGFTFFTNYGSRKGHQLDENPRAALVFHWAYLGRQVRIEGSVVRVSREESEAYFHSRPRQHQLGAVASSQSSVIASRTALTDTYRKLQKQYKGKEVPLPATWGGYRLSPDSIEFWTHRKSRLHDRVRYRLVKGLWVSERLAP